MTDLDTNKIMKGSPPPLEYQVTLENWRKYPFNIWSFVNVRSIIPTSPIKSDPKQKIELNKKLIDLNELKISHNNSKRGFVLVASVTNSID